MLRVSVALAMLLAAPAPAIAAGATDLRLGSTTVAGADGRLRTTVVVRNAGPRAAQVPVLESRAPFDVTGYGGWESGCTPLASSYSKDRCQLPALPRGASRTLVYVSEGPGGQIEVRAERPDLDAVDNAVTITGTVAAELTPDGPATLMNRWLGGHTLEGRSPQVLLAVRVLVGAGGRAGAIRLRVGMRGKPSVLGEPFTLPAEPGTYTVPAPRINGDYRSGRVGIDQLTGGHALITPRTCVNEPARSFDPCQIDLLDVFGGSPPPGDAGTPSETRGGRPLALTPIYEDDGDQDLRSDETEDRTDLRLRTRSRVDGKGRLRTTVTVSNEGPVAATIPVVQATRSAVVGMRWGSECLPVVESGRRDRWRCRVRSVPAGGSRTVTLISEPRREPRTITLELVGQGVDLDTADNTRVVRVAR